MIITPKQQEFAMGYYWDWIDEKWEPKNHERKFTREVGVPIRRRGELIDHLLAEIEQGGNGVTALYAGLLARALVKTDEILMDKHGERVVKATSQARGVKAK